MRYMHKQWIGNGKHESHYGTVELSPQPLVHLKQKYKVLLLLFACKMGKGKIKKKKESWKLSQNFWKERLEDAYLTREINKRFGIQFGQGTLFLPICVGSV